MKKLLLFLIIPFISFSQDLKSDSIAILTTFSKDMKLAKEFYSSSCITNYEDYDKIGSNRSLFFISDILKCKKYSDDKPSYFVKGYFLGSPYFTELPDNKIVMIKKNVIKIDSLFQEFQKLDIDAKSKIDDYAKYRSDNFKILYETELLEYLSSFQKFGIGIIEAVPTSNYSMTGAEFKVMNFSNKTIKYITFNFYGKNAVKDKVQYRNGVYNISRKGIGPVNKNVISSWSFDDVWLTDIVQYLTLISVSIQYMDGTTKTVKITKEIWLDEDKVDMLKDLYKEELEKE